MAAMVERQLQPPDRLFSPTAPPHVDPTDAEMWWVLLQSRIEDMRLRIPAALVGALQFEVLEQSGRRFYYVELAGPRTRAGEGLLASSDAWITTRGDDLAMMISSPLPGQSPSFEVIGQLGLVQRFFASLDGGKPTNAIGLRSST